MGLAWITPPAVSRCRLSVSFALPRRPSCSPLQWETKKMWHWGRRAFARGSLFLGRLVPDLVRVKAPLNAAEPTLDWYQKQRTERSVRSDSSE